MPESLNIGIVLPISNPHDLEKPVRLDRHESLRHTSLRGSRTGGALDESAGQQGRP